MIPFPLQQLRQQYPAAGLTTHLLTIHQDCYVVQAVVRTEEGVLAAAMAAHPEIELAEDAACQRLLVRLGLVAEGDAEAEPSAAEESAAPAEAPTPPGPPAEPPPAEPPPAEPPPREAAAPTAAEPPEPPAEPWDAAAADIFESPAPEPPAPEPAAPIFADEDFTGAEAVSKPALVGSVAAPSPHQATVVAATTSPVDLSDIIVQTDVELRRLGWSVQQGREFLERTYGKRSRRELTDEELLEFLLHLESQP